MRVLLVEDDVMIGRSLDRALTHAGMAVDWVRSSADCTTAIANDGYSVLLLDLGLPDGAGLDILRAMRRQNRDMPVVIIPRVTTWRRESPASTAAPTTMS